MAIQPENQTLASVTFQNYFRLYENLSGMTGTALTEADEFLDIYGLDVVEIPPIRRLPAPMMMTRFIGRWPRKTRQLLT